MPIDNPQTTDKCHADLIRSRAKYLTDAMNAAFKDGLHVSIEITHHHVEWWGDKYERRGKFIADVDVRRVTRV